MKKTLLLCALLVSAFSNAQNLITEGFDTYANLATAGWLATNQSSPLGASTWAQGGGTAFATGGQAGGATSFALCNFNSTTGAGTISNWLITPVLNLQNGDVVTFYSRTGGTSSPFPDRLEVRLNTTDATVGGNPSGATGVGAFTTVALTINPNLTTTGYPLTWTQYTYTITGLTGIVASKIGFRYFVIDGGPDGSNSNIIGLDSFSVDRPVASTQSFFANNFSIYPNPANNVLNLSVKNGLAINEITMVDINGRTVKTITNSLNSEMEINVSDLTSGVYMLNVKTDEGVATSKFVKN
ncbi:choice-of-anchor J domain-containing protein [uncultured Flavobacterium sp.]|uniref:T9SS-dependent choice-of-anchor J family protein n=1 Tax=uncultured Flavobacterium sp. TaxID=165435 RepID=UPI0030EE8F10|tara:strand:+ start:36101 stop:36994 length:894 start_codon:yes stop_codon:yes gene_type:complete